MRRARFARRVGWLGSLGGLGLRPVGSGGPGAGVSALGAWALQALKLGEPVLFKRSRHPARTRKASNTARVSTSGDDWGRRLSVVLRRLACWRAEEAEGRTGAQKAREGQGTAWAATPNAAPRPVPTRDGHVAGVGWTGTPRGAAPGLRSPGEGLRAGEGRPPPALSRPHAPSRAGSTRSRG